MRAGRPSGTSTLVCFMRALSHAGLTRVRGFADPCAVRLLPAGPALAVRALARAFGGRPEAVRRLGERSGGMLDLVALRTRHIDACWAEARALGARQLVLLGAGLDARAHRLPDLEGVRVYEVDHPATQAEKRARAAGLPLAADSLAYVPVDLTRDELSGALRRAGLDPGAPSFWIWEGVTPYLPREATRATLAQVAGLCAPGSRLCTTYVVPPERAASAELSRVRAFAGRLGEPFVGMLRPEELAGLLREAGLELCSDSSVDDWARSYSDAPPGLAERFPSRIALAERRG